MKSTEELLQFMNNINNQIESLIVKSNKIGMFNHIIALDNVTNKHLNSVKDITIKISTGRCGNPADLRRNLIVV